MYNYITGSLSETYALAEAVAALLRPGDVVAFRGDMGVGKTAFTQGLARGLEVEDLVFSPTFTIINVYPPSVHRHSDRGISLVHCDFYRLSSESDLESTGFFDYLYDPDTVLVLEWSERVPRLISGLKSLITITIDYGKNTSERLVSINGGDGRFEHISY